MPSDTGVYHHLLLCATKHSSQGTGHKAFAFASFNGNVSGTGGQLVVVYSQGDGTQQNIGNTTVCVYCGHFVHSFVHFDSCELACCATAEISCVDQLTKQNCSSVIMDASRLLADCLFGGCLPFWYIFFGCIYLCEARRRRGCSAVASWCC